LQAHRITARAEVLPDDREQITARLRALVEDGVDLVLTTGGTGLGPRDVTVEATREVIDREIPGIAEAARAYGQERTPYAMFSRGVAGVSGKTIIVNLPGSSRGAEETMNAIFPALLHAYGMLQGEGH
jgi:cyclic pyranopterin phosphate synthase